MGANFTFAGVRLGLRQFDRCHQHARRAKSALQGVILLERGLHRMQFRFCPETFDCRHVGTVCARSQHGAGFHAAAVDMHIAGAALTGVTADMGTGQAEPVAQEVASGVAVVALNPGIIDTDMLRSCFGESAASYPDAKAWAARAVPFLENLDSSDNGRALTAP